MGGMAAQIPIKNNPAANEAAMNKARHAHIRSGHTRGLLQPAAPSLRS